MGRNNNICATCKWAEQKPIMRDGKPEIPKDGFCYANPPFPGGFNPKVVLRGPSCRLWESAK